MERHSYLVKSNNIYSTTKIDMFGVETIDPFLLKSFLSKCIVSCQGRWKHRVNNKCKDVQTVEQTFSECTLGIIVLIVVDELRNDDKSYPKADPHVERVSHTNETKSKEHSDRLEKIIIECQVQRRWKQNCSDQFSLGCHESCPNDHSLAVVTLSTLPCHNLYRAVTMLQGVIIYL